MTLIAVGPFWRGAYLKGAGELIINFKTVKNSLRKSQLMENRSAKMVKMVTITDLSFYQRKAGRIQKDKT